MARNKHVYTALFGTMQALKGLNPCAHWSILPTTILGKQLSWVNHLG